MEFSTSNFLQGLYGIKTQSQNAINYDKYGLIFHVRAVKEERIREISRNGGKENEIEIEGRNVREDERTSDKLASVI